MSRYIDADTIEYTHAIARCLEDGHNRNELCVTKDEIADMPTADVRKNVHGEWITHKNAEIAHDLFITNYECSICHTWSRYNSNYCPDCGADMRGES